MSFAGIALIPENTLRMNLKIRSQEELLMCFERSHFLTASVISLCGDVRLFCKQWCSTCHYIAKRSFSGDTDCRVQGVRIENVKTVFIL